MTYRLLNGHYELVTDVALTMMKKGDDFLFADIRGPKQEMVNAENDKIIRATIKSRSYLAKQLLNMGLPASFSRLVCITVLCMLVAIGISIAEYIILMSLFQDVESELDLVAIQYDQVRCVVEASTWVMQAVALNE